MEKWISQVPMKKNTNQFRIFGMKEEKFILMKFKTFFNIGWMNKPNLNNKKRQLSE